MIVPSLKATETAHCQQKSIDTELRSLQEHFDSVSPDYDAAGFTDFGEIIDWNGCMREIRRWFKHFDNTKDASELARAVKICANGMSVEMIMQMMMKERFDQLAMNSEERENDANEYVYRLLKKNDQMPRPFHTELDEVRLNCKFSVKRDLRGSSRYNRHRKYPEHYHSKIFEVDAITLDTQNRVMMCFDAKAAGPKFFRKKVETLVMRMQSCITALQQEMGYRVHIVIVTPNSLDVEHCHTSEQVSYLTYTCPNAVNALQIAIKKDIEINCT